jgi:two-component system probable response regulator PhcQ
LVVGCRAPASAWHQWDFGGLLQAETQRGIAIAQSLKSWQAQFGQDRSAPHALALLAQALGGQAEGSTVKLSTSAPLTALLVAGSEALPQAADTAWLAWLLWSQLPVEVASGAEGACTVRAIQPGDEPATPPNWLERMIEQLLER